MMNKIYTGRCFMKWTLVVIGLTVVLGSSQVFAGIADDINKSTGSKLGTETADMAKSKASSEANKAVASKLNKRLLEESRKNQCSFKSGTDELEKGCDDKSKRLANVIVEIKKSLQSKGQTGYKFVVSGHTDSSGDAAKNKELSLRRAQVMMKQLIAKGVAADDIEAVGMGSEKMLVKPDDTPKKKAKNRRYEVGIRF